MAEDGKAQRMVMLDRSLVLELIEVARLASVEQYAVDLAQAVLTRIEREGGGLAQAALRGEDPFST